MEEIKKMIEQKVNGVSAKAREIVLSNPLLAEMSEGQVLGFYEMVIFRLLCEKDENNN